MMSEDGNNCDDLEITEVYNPNTPEAVREPLAQAKAPGDCVVVSGSF